MQLHKTLASEHTKAVCTKIVNWIGTSQERFDELFEIFLTDEYKIVQRAAWPMSYAVIAHPILIRKNFGRLIKNLDRSGLHPAVKRNTVRLLQDISIPKRLHGRIMDLCFNYISDPKEQAAIKAFSLTILENLAKEYPEIKQELKTIIEDRWPFETAAFRARGKKILKRLESTK